MTNWLTEAEVSRATGVDIEVLRAGIESGMFDTWARVIDGEIRYRPGTVAFVLWTSKVIDRVMAGKEDIFKAHRRIHRRAQQGAPDLDADGRAQVRAVARIRRALSGTDARRAITQALSGIGADTAAIELRLSVPLG